MAERRFQISEEEKKKIIKLSIEEGLPGPVIAQRFGRSVNYVNNVIREGKKRAREQTAEVRTSG